MTTIQMNPHIYYTQNLSSIFEMNFFYFAYQFSFILKGKIHIISLKGAFMNTVELDFFYQASAVYLLVWKEGKWLFIYVWSLSP